MGDCLLAPILASSMAADERGIALPKGCGWQTLRSKSGTEVLDGYSDMLGALASRQA
jgi:hypothetical protein